MYGLKKLLEEEKLRLERIREKAEKSLPGAPEGSLWISENKRQVMMFHSMRGNGDNAAIGRYIRKNEENLARQLAQKEYDSKILRLTEKRIKQISLIQKDYLDDEIEQLYLKMHSAKQALIDPVEETWEQRLSKWKNESYLGKGFESATPVITTKRGERVRSKSEKILADMFYDYGIEYKYECPLILKGYGVVYPDFTFIKKNYNKEIYWEHDGKMDNSEYCNSAIRKIESYVKNGIFPGEQLIITYETSGYVFSDAMIRSLIEKYLL